MLINIFIIMFSKIDGRILFSLFGYPSVAFVSRARPAKKVWGGDTPMPTVRRSRTIREFALII